MTSLSNIFSGSLKAITNPKDFKGHLTGGYSNTKKMNEEDERSRRPVEATASSQGYAAPSGYEPGYAPQEKSRAPNSRDGEELLTEQTSAKKKLLGA